MQSKKPKVLITLREDGQNGGPYISHTRILNSSLSEKYELIPFYNANARKLRNPKTFFKTVKRIKKAKADAVTVAGLQIEGFLMTLACKFAGVKAIVVVHGSSTQAIGISKIKKIIFGFLEKCTLLMSKASFGVSDYVSSWEICRKAKNYYGTIYNMMDISQKSPQEAYIRKELGIPENDIVIVSTGRIIKDKGFDILWETIKELNAPSNVKFVIAGEGNYKQQWQEELEKEGFGDRVFLLGYRNDIDNILSESDIFIICTKHETLCISLIEAAGFSLPLVATNVGGIPEIIADSKNGYLIDLCDVNGFTKALEKLIEDNELRIRLGKEASKRVTEKFGEKAITERLDELYKKVLNK